MKPEKSPQLLSLYDTDGLAERSSVHAGLSRRGRQIQAILRDRSQSERVVLTNGLLQTLAIAVTSSLDGEIAFVDQLGDNGPDSSYGTLSNAYDRYSLNGVTMLSRILWVGFNKKYEVPMLLKDNSLTADAYFVTLTAEPEAGLRHENIRVGWIEDQEGHLATFSIEQDASIDTSRPLNADDSRRLFRAIPLSAEARQELLCEADLFIGSH